MNVKRAIKEEGNVVFTLNWGFSYVGSSRRLEVMCNAGFEGWLWTSGRLERAELWDTPDRPPTCPFCFIQMEEQPCAGTAPCGLRRIPLYIPALVSTQHHNSTQKARSSLGTLIFSSLLSLVLKPASRVRRQLCCSRECAKAPNTGCTRITLMRAWSGMSTDGIQKVPQAVMQRGRFRPEYCWA